MKIIYLCSLFLFFSACSTSKSVRTVEDSNGDKFYISNGFEAFLLPNIPSWLNFSTEGMCEREYGVSYLNFENIASSYNLDYEQLIHTQHMWNRNLEKLKNTSGDKAISTKNQAYIFNKIYALIQSGVREFKQPEYKRVNILWIDSMLKNKKSLKRVLKSEDFLENYPVLLSQCLSSFELESLVEELELEDLGASYISSEMFSIYSNELIPQTKFSLDLKSILPKKEIKIFTTNPLLNIYGADQIKIIK